METCPNCNTKLKSSFVSATKLMTEEEISFIHDFTNHKEDVFCTKCGNIPLKEAADSLKIEFDQINLFLIKNISSIPIASTHSPYNWNYRVLGIVTGQTTTGTGVIAEFTSSFTDFFGTQSKTYNKKIADGEQLAFAQIRLKTIELGGNAVIATDIDYTEVGTGKGMLMVCVTGTAVNLLNTDVLDAKLVSMINEITNKNKRKQFLLEKYSSILLPN